MNLLRDALLQALTTLPGTRTFHVHVLVSSPRKHANLYPFATPRPRTFLQDVLVLLSEQPTPESPRVFVSAIEASLYHVPSTSSAILYVSKVDSTGQAKSPSPTQALVRAFLTYYMDPTTRPLSVSHLWVHLFARAQNQYLFPNSSAYPGKRPLTDLQLCAWWKRQFSQVAQAMGQGSIRLFYLLPGLGKEEAFHALERVYGPTTGTSVPWSYGHPYSHKEVPLPCSPIGRGEKSSHIGHVIPWFDDDPKGRFLDEIAYTTDGEGVRSPERKRARTSGPTPRTDEDAESGTDKRASSKTEQTSKALGKVTIEEFWERMSFRQECIAGAVTGFFVMETSSPTPLGTQGPLAGQVSSQMMKRVLTSLMTGHEFASVDRAVWSTRVLEVAIRGLCDGLGREAPGDSHAEPEDPETPGRGLSDKKDHVGDVSAAGFYETYIYGTVEVRNAEEARKTVEKGGVGVTVLTVRRKRRGKE